MTVFAWDLVRKGYTPINHIVSNGYTLCWAAKWYRKREIMFDSVYESSPKKMLKGIHKLIDLADAIVTYNGVRYDLPILNKGFVDQNLRPPTQYENIDLLQVVRGRFKFHSNKLDFVAQELGVGAKVKHKGMDLWRECMAGDKAAWRTMKKYNIHDVRILERVYKVAIPWIQRHPNWGLYVKADRPICRNCGSKRVTGNGVRRSTVATYQRWMCQDCGTSMRSRRKMPREDSGVLV